MMVLTFAACEKDINLKLKEGGGRLVLFSFLTPDSVFSVHLSRSVSHSSIDDFERVYNGYIKIIQNGDKVDSFKYPFKELWAYRENLVVKTGDLFEIEAGDMDGNSITGSTLIPPVVKIDDLDTIRRLSPNINGGMGYFIDCYISFNDPPRERNYYQLILSEEIWDNNGGDIKYSYQLINFIKDDPVFYIRDQEGSLLGGIDFKGTFPDELFDGTKKKLKVRIPASFVEKPESGRKRRLTFLLLSQTMDYFNYLRSRVVAEHNYELPIVDPIKIHTNVKGGLGLVGGISVARDSLVFERL